MIKARKSGITVKKIDVPIILGMVGRGDRRHDIAAWFGLNQGRIKEVEDGDHGTPPIADKSQLPPSGSPGLKARTLRAEAEKVLHFLQEGKASAAIEALKKATAAFDRDE